MNEVTILHTAFYGGNKPTVIVQIGAIVIHVRPAGGLFPYTSTMFLVAEDGSIVQKRVDAYGLNALMAVKNALYAYHKMWGKNAYDPSQCLSVLPLAKLETIYNESRWRGNWDMVRTIEGIVAHRGGIVTGGPHTGFEFEMAAL